MRKEDVILNEGPRCPHDALMGLIRPFSYKALKGLIRPLGLYKVRASGHFRHHDMKVGVLNFQLSAYGDNIGSLLTELC